MTARGNRDRIFMTIIFKKSIKGRRGVALPDLDVPLANDIPQEYRRSTGPDLCELSELDVVRHFTELSRKNFGVDTNFYPLGSCTMKYNPKICEKIAQLEGFSALHPLLPQLRRGGMLTQGALAVIYELERLLCEITGMDAFTLQPMAGAHGELTGMMLIAAYHKNKGNKKNEVLIPDEAHGTNPSSAAIAGYIVRPVPTNTETGMIDVSVLESMIGPQTAAIMMTNPNTLGIFNSHIEKISLLARSFDALLYYDGANLNAILGKFRPGDANFDVMHVNLHKTFATPHGGGGPGYGNFSVCLKAYAYILMLGAKGLIEVSENAVLNSNYVMHSLKDHFHVPYLRTCMHECVISAKKQSLKGVSALDIAKSLIDMGFHPPTVYFPLIVKEALMIEPTETESKETLDLFIAAMKTIADTTGEKAREFHEAPITTPVGRLDEVKAARDMDCAFL